MRLVIMGMAMPIFKTKDENFFKTWSPEMAYVLGFFTADGNMHKNKRGAYFIEVTNIDKEILQSIQGVLGSNHKLSVIDNKPGCQTAYRFQIGSKEIFNDLLELGLTPRKSKTILLPSVPEIYFGDFVRGYFDGDGHVRAGIYRKLDRKSPSHIIMSGFTSGSRQFLKQLKSRLEKRGIRGGTLHYSGGGHRLAFSISDSLVLYRILYGDNPSKLFLARKWQIFEKYFGIA